MKPSCPSSTPTLKQTSASGSSPCGQADADQRAREAEAVQQAEGERHHPRVPDREARLAAPAAHDLRPEEEDAERDRRLDRRPRAARRSRASPRRA